MLPQKQNPPYDVIMGKKLMKELQMGVIYSEDVLVLDRVKLQMQKIHNGECTDLNLMDQEDPESIK